MLQSSQTPFVVEGIDHILLLVNGMDVAVSFYCDVLGCSVEDRLPQFAMIQLRAGSALIDLVDIQASEGQWARPEKPGGRNMDHVCIAISRCDEQQLRKHLAAHQVPIVEEGMHRGARGNSLSIYVRDPSNNVIELKGASA
jgi:catechol 2,3-dioxygenase-like lactoylglutathione lyase family enzyme